MSADRKKVTVSLYSTAIRKKYFREMAKIRWHLEKKRYYKGWMKRYRESAIGKRWELKGTGKELREMIRKIHKEKLVPKVRHEKAKSVEELEEKAEREELWIDQKTMVRS